MITLTPAAAAQVRKSAQAGRTGNLPLRLAVTQQPDGSLHYAMGFDDLGGQNDTKTTSEGVEIVIAPTSTAMLTGTTVDYVEMEPGEYRFIFLNPNDPNYSPPQETPHDIAEDDGSNADGQ